VSAAAIAEFHDLPLRPHPACAASPLRAISVSGALHADGRITLDYLLQGELLLLRLPLPARIPQRRDELWRHTCLELFARRETAADYVEFNFSPSGDWAAYGFESYRRGAAPFEQQPVGITSHPLGPGQLRIQACAQLPRAILRWRLGFAAVVEADDGTLGYWALRHSGEKPDFHAAENFHLALEVAPQPARAALT
jgi:hypothetical protein